MMRVTVTGIAFDWHLAGAVTTTPPSLPGAQLGAVIWEGGQIAASRSGANVYAVQPLASSPYNGLHGVGRMVAGAFVVC